MNDTLIIKGKQLSGTLYAPPSKSYTHRALIAAALADGRSVVRNLELSDDVEATLGAVRALGAAVELAPAAGGRSTAAVEGIGRGGVSAPRIDCRESGSTLRFLMPVALAVAGGALFTGGGRLGRRPLTPYFDIFAGQGIAMERAEGGFPLELTGWLRPGHFALTGGVSSQFVTGLLLALPLLPGDSDVVITDTLESKAYVDMAVDVLKDFGVRVDVVERYRRYLVPGGQRYQPREYEVEGDWSQAAFPLLMGLLGPGVEIHGLNRRGRQGDSAIVDIFASMGGKMQWRDETLIAERSRLYGTMVDVSQCPDLAPAVAAALAVAEGSGRIVGGRRLRDKESDRIASITGCLRGLGADARPTDDGMEITGVAALAGGVADSAGDHRIAMMAAALSPLCRVGVVLRGAAAVNKSWPSFWKDFSALGGEWYEQPVG